jgi:hypothetical protein
MSRRATGVGPAVILGSCLLLAGGCTGQEAAPAATPHSCTDDRPEFAAGSQAAVSILPGEASELTLHSAFRDAGTTLVGFCSERGALPAHAPQLVEEGTEPIRPSGGFTVDDGRAPKLYFIYRATTAASVTVRSIDERLGVIEFGAVPADRCAEVPDDRVIACGMLTVVRLVVPATGVRASRVQDVEGTTRDGSNDLGFYFFGVTDTPGGVELTLAFRPGAQTQMAVVEPRTIYLDTGAVDVSGRRWEIDLTGAVR